jgi:voltage-gated sodium channel
MSERDLLGLLESRRVGPWRVRVARVVESAPVQRLIIALILVNAAVLGLETDAGTMERWGGWLKAIDKFCLVFFLAELLAKLAAYRGAFWRNGWNVFDALVVGIALVPGAGPWSVLRSLRVLRVLRLFSMVPQLRRVVGAFLHAIPGLFGVIAVMAVFFYTAGVLATVLFGTTHPQWFGSLGHSLFTLFQIMTLESWSMGVVRPVMESHPWAWAFFVPFIVIATFTILNLFIGIIVSTMQELSTLPEGGKQQETLQLLEKIERDLQSLRSGLAKEQAGG